MTSSSACVMPATSPPWTSGARGTRRSRRPHHPPAQVYSEMSMEDFVKNLTVFSEETIR